jgi:hypothetical protein
MRIDHQSKDFVALILTHGRADNVVTYEVIRNSGYTGPIRIVVDSFDKQIDRYKERFGDEVVVFDKQAVIDRTESGDNFHDHRTITYARSVSFEIAKSLGFKYFIQLDDDYTNMQYRFDGDDNYKPKTIRNLDAVWEAMVRFLESTPRVKCVAMAQGGDFIGGEDGAVGKSWTLKRKAMNSFICRSDDPIAYLGRMNEDVNTFTRYGNLGTLFATTMRVNLNQLATQSNAGGITELYQSAGTYVKSFYTVMFNPAGTVVTIMNSRSNPRIHHNVIWDRTVPRIVPEEYRKV